ncbi:MAG TPA: polysaccharide deacetylase family protein [Jatrophihabitantaceae bacterium]|jgi:peptidoglycan/xylan/chitin deacetylase (PgdA/CDA1 family)
MRPGLALGVLAGAQFLPTVLAVGPVRRRVAPGLSGQGRSGHVALSFDDGPHPVSTPRFLDTLAAHDVCATFFVLGSQVAAHPAVARQIVDAGHEIAAHGWTHRSHLRRGPRDVANDLRRAVDIVEDVTGVRVRYWRPPYGIATGASLLAARHCGLRPVWWTVAGADWTAQATPESVRGAVLAGLRDGGTVLLHDADTTSAHGAWRATLGALPDLLRDCAERSWEIGTVGAHGLNENPGGVIMQNRPPGKAAVPDHATGARARRGGR